MSDAQSWGHPDDEPASWPYGSLQDSQPIPADGGGGGGGGGGGAPIEPGSEPVVIGQAVTTVLTALAGLGWVTLDSATAKLVGSAVAAILVVVITVVVRARVWTTASVRREVHFARPAAPIAPAPAEQTAQIVPPVQRAPQVRQQQAQPSRQPRQQGRSATAPPGAHRRPDRR